MNPGFCGRMTWRAIYARPWVRVGADADVAGVLAGAEAMIRLGLTRAVLFETTVGWCRSKPVLKAPGFGA